MSETPATPAAPQGTPAAAPEAPATPAAAPAAAPAAEAPISSLIPENPGEAPKADDKPAQPAAPVSNDPPWFYADGTPGKGPPPAWYKADKYKTVEAQAAAYAELEKRFGSFTGAPKDGKYEFKLPEGVKGELDQEHPVLKGFNEWATKNQLNNQGYNELLGMLIQYDIANQPDLGQIKKDLGDKADERITAAAQWAKANLGADGFKKFRIATSGHEAAAVFEVLEAVINKTRQVSIQKPADDVPGAQATGEAAIRAMQAQKNDKGQRLYEIDPEHRRKVDKAWNDYYAGLQQQ